MKPPWKAAACAEGGYLEPLVLLEPPAHNTGCCVLGLACSSGTSVSFFVFTAGCKASGPPGPPLHPPWNPWKKHLSQGTGQGVSMTFNAASRLRSLEDRSAALGSSRCELPGMHSVPKSAGLPYAFGVGGLSRRLLNNRRPEAQKVQKYATQQPVIRIPSWASKISTSELGFGRHIGPVIQQHTLIPLSYHENCTTVFSSCPCMSYGQYFW